MQFGNYISVLLLVVPLVAFIAYYCESKRQKVLTKFLDRSLLEQVAKGAASNRKYIVRVALLKCLIAALLVIAIFRPQWGFEWRESNKKGVDIAVAIDVSQSMLAEDVKPSRLERARRELSDLIDRFTGDRVALIAFAGTAFIETPLTLDYSMFRMFLDELSPELIPIPGSNIHEALKESIQALAESTEDNKKVKSNRGKAVILITDGEDIEGDFTSVKQLATENDIKIYVIGMGTIEGAPIPTPQGYKKDGQGNVVISRLNEKILAELAEQTGGVYVTSIGSEKDTFEIYDSGIKSALEDSTIAGADAKRWNEYYQLPLFLALLLLIIESLSRTNLRTLKSKKIDLVNRSGTTALTSIVLLTLLILTTPSNSYADETESLGKQGKLQLEQGDFKSAIETFSKAAEKNPDDARFYLGQGVGQYRLGNFEEALSAFEKAKELATGDKLKAEALYNLGNTLVQKGEYQQALENYKQSAALASTDREVKENLEYVKKLIKEQEQQQNQQQEKNNKEQDEQQEKQEKDQQQSEQQQDKQQNADQDNSKEQENQDKQSEESQNQNQQQQAKDKQNKGDQSKEQENNNEEQEQSEQDKNQEQAEEQQSQEQHGQQGSQSQEKEGKELTEEDINSSQLSAVLDSVEERKDLLIKHRRDKILQDAIKRQELKRAQDW